LAAAGARSLTSKITRKNCLERTRPRGIWLQNRTLEPRHLGAVRKPVCEEAGQYLASVSRPVVSENVPAETSFKKTISCIFFWHHFLYLFLAHDLLYLPPGLSGPPTGLGTEAAGASPLQVPLLSMIPVPPLLFAPTAPPSTHKRPHLSVYRPRRR